MPSGLKSNRGGGGRGGKMRSGGGGRRKAGNADTVLSPGTRTPEAEGLVGVETPQETVREEAGEGAATEAVGGFGNEGLIGGEEEDDEGAEESDEEEEEEEKVEGEEERPKLEDGFYEIEDIRKKRVRKGQIQFLIKWRGWPETANTWEPLDNLKPCADIIEAFEERQKVTKATRKRKRKSSGSLSVGRKRRISGNKQRAGSVASSLSKAKPADLDLLSSDGFASGGAKESTTGGEEGFSVEGTTIQAESKLTEEVENPILGNNEKPAPDKMAGLDSTEEGAGIVSIDLRLGEENKTSKAEPSAQRFTGARKRKSGCVRRFKQDASENGSNSQGLAAGKTVNEDLATEGAEVGGGHPTTKDGGLVKIVKAVACAAAISNDIQSVSITFVAQRSDGREVQVNNEFLKSHYPALLIDFYEQHLRFGSS